ncbi:MAG: hypothetical protein MJ106_01285 [Lentisphaeria bacterium]|nr:hypothetical protein [Lentisphaeria bacterium]
MPRFLAPRVVIYAIILLAVAWVMWRMEKEPKPVRKQITMPEKIAVQNERTMPMLVLVAGVDDDLDEFHAQVQKEFSDKWQISLVTVASESDEALFKKTFMVESLPAAVLVDTDNQIVGSVSDNLSLEALHRLEEK